MSDSYTDVETHVQAALASILSDTTSNIVALAWEYTIPASWLQARYKERKDRSNCGENDHTLSDDQELTLCQIIKCEEADETSLQHWQLQSHMNWILIQDHLEKWFEKYKTARNKFNVQY